MNAPRPSLATEDIDRFRRDGFLVLRGVLDLAGVAAARARLWGLLPPWFRPDDARTWRGVVEDESGSIDLLERRGRVKLRGALRSDPLLCGLLPHDPTVGAAVATLMAPHAVATPVRVRGIYLTFPMPELPQAHGHVDLHDYAVGAVAYLDEVPLNGGGLLVWPGTHHDRVTPLAARQHVEPVDVLELTGTPGDVVLYDRHLVHAPARNRLPRVRPALLCDFHLAGLPAARPDAGTERGDAASRG